MPIYSGGMFYSPGTVFPLGRRRKTRKGPIEEEMKRSSLIQRFSLLSLAAFLVVGLVLGGILTSSLEKTVVDRSKNETARFVIAEVDRVFPGMDFSVPMTGPRYEDFQKGASHLKFDPSIKRIKVWNPDSVVVWSDERQLVGKQFPNHKELLAALNGTIRSEISSLGKQENRTERQYHRLLELYVPIRSGREGNVKAVFEIYQDLESLDADTSRQKRILWISIVAGFSGIYFACFGIVWRASRRLTEQTLEVEKSEERNRNQFHFLQVILDAIPTPIFYKDARGFFLGCNKAYEEYIGLLKDRLVGKTVYDIAPKDLADIYRDADDALFRKGGSQVYEAGMVPADGKRHDVIFSKATFPDPDGSLGGLVGTILDITERKRSEEARTRLGMAVDQAAEGIVITDTKGRIEYINPSFERITGYLRKEAVGQNMRILKSGKQDEMFYRNMWETISRGEVWRGRLINKKKDGTLYEEDAIISPVRNASGKIINFVAGKQDITQDVILKKQVQTAQRMESVGTLAGGIAHDFNNALTGIMGFGELMRLRLAGDSKSAADLDEILRCAERAATLTRQLLTFARRQVIEPVNLSLSALVGDLMKLIGKVVGEHIEVKTSLEKNLPTIHADRGQIEQVVMNLCLNARDAMPEGGLLVVETEDVSLEEEFVRQNPYMRAGRYALLTVSDTGTGMDEKTRERVFEPFFTTKGPDKGTGLGLAMVYGIVKSHGGFIHLYSEPGKGTAFKVYFPAIEAQPDAVPANRGDEIVRGGAETILLAEDEESLRALAERILTAFGYTVLVARDGEEAVEVLDRNVNVDLAVLDVVMPRKGGKEAYEEMRRKNPNLKVLFMSGYSVDAGHESFVLTPGTPFLPKPYTPSLLARKVREALDRK